MTRTFLDFWVPGKVSTLRLTSKKRLSRSQGSSIPWGIPPTIFLPYASRHSIGKPRLRLCQTSNLHQDHRRTSQCRPRPFSRQFYDKSQIGPRIFSGRPLRPSWKQSRPGQRGCWRSNQLLDLRPCSEWICQKTAIAVEVVLPFVLDQDLLTQSFLSSQITQIFHLIDFLLLRRRHCRLFWAFEYWPLWFKRNMGIR